MMERHHPTLASWANGIAPRLLVMIVLFSSLVTVLSTATQLFLDYRRGVHAIESRLDDIEHSNLGSLAGSLWNVDTQQLRLQLDGLLHLPDMQALELRETLPGIEKPLILSVGERLNGGSISRLYPLIYDDHGTAVQVGSLYAEASLTAIYQRLWDQAVFILISQGIKTFIVSLFTLFIVYRLITRHLIHISHHLDQDGQTGTLRPITLPRRAPSRTDELDQLVNALNTTSANLHQTVERLTLSNREMERFAYIASHDLQEPLRSVVSFTQLLERHLLERHLVESLDGESRDYIRYITGGALRMRSLIHDFLAFSQINQSTQPIVCIPMAEACETALQRLSNEISTAQAVIHLSSLPEIYGDRQQIITVFEQLLSNAIKFRLPSRAPIIRVDAEQLPDGNWQFGIHDDGIGISETQHDIFDVFRRLHPVGQYPGTGIGLAICKRIILRHGGQIWVNSQLNRGTDVYFSLPAGPSVIDTMCR